MGTKVMTKDELGPESGWTWEEVGNKVVHERAQASSEPACERIGGEKRKKEKRGSSPISRVLSDCRTRDAAIGQSFLWTPRCRDVLAAYPEAARATPSLPYLALPRMGFAVPALLPVLRWALTRRYWIDPQPKLRHPFTLACAHPRISPRRGHRRFALCCTFRRLAAPGR